MKCSNCGSEVSDKFCIKCGRPVEKFYQKTWFILLMLFVFAPVGIYLAWVFRKQWGRNALIAASAGSALIFLFTMIGGGSSEKSKANALMDTSTSISELEKLMTSESSIIDTTMEVTTTVEPTTDETTAATTTEETTKATTTATTINETTKQTTTAITSKETTAATTTASTTTAQTAAPTTTNTTSASTPIEITGANSIVAPGEIASITIKATPNTQYSITVIYKSGPSTSKDLYPKTSDADGVVNWTWKVGSNTAPGTYTIKINGDDETITTSFTVQ